MRFYKTVSSTYNILGLFAISNSSPYRISHAILTQSASFAGRLLFFDRGEATGSAFCDIPLSFTDQHRKRLQRYYCVRHQC